MQEFVKKAPSWLKGKAAVKTLALIIATPPLAMMPMASATAKLSQTTLWSLCFLVILINGVRLISKRNGSGWGWIAYFFYANSFTQVGIVAWLYIAIAGWGLWIIEEWKKPKKNAVE